MWEAIAALGGRLAIARPMQDEADFRLAHLAHLEVAASDEFAIRAWDGLITTPVNQLAVYHQTGIKPAELADPDHQGGRPRCDRHRSEPMMTPGARPTRAAVLLVTLLGAGCATPAPVLQLAERTSGNVSLVNTQLEMLAQESRRLAEARAANIGPAPDRHERREAPVRHRSRDHGADGGGVPDRAGEGLARVCSEARQAPGGIGAGGERPGGTRHRSSPGLDRPGPAAQPARQRAGRAREGRGPQSPRQVPVGLRRERRDRSQGATEGEGGGGRQSQDGGRRKYQEGFGQKE